jgi:predicted transglutaminase-like cysteine proteinase
MALERPRMTGVNIGPMFSPPRPSQAKQPTAHTNGHRLQRAVVTAALMASFVGQAGLVDFSRNLLNWTEQRWGNGAPTRLQTWQRLVRDSQALVSSNRVDTAQLLARSNDFFNQIPYMTDQQHWGAEDYWATPVESLGSLGADCEDYAVAKYLTLKELGVPIDRLRITYVRALRLNEAHMVLAYYPSANADPLILDNLNPVIRPASQRTDLEPVYSFNDDDLWLPNGLTNKGGSTQVRLWKDLQAKLLREQQM